jgi:hypothetical protein
MLVWHEEIRLLHSLSVSIPFVLLRNARHKIATPACAVITAVITANIKHCSVSSSTSFVIARFSVLILSDFLTSYKQLLRGVTSSIAACRLVYVI